MLGAFCSGVWQIVRIKLIRKKFTDQLDPQLYFIAGDQVDSCGSSGSVRVLQIKLIHKLLTDQVDSQVFSGSSVSSSCSRINYNICGSHYNTRGSNNISWAHSNRFKCSRGIFVFLLWVLGAPTIMLGARSNSQVLNMKKGMRDLVVYTRANIRYD